MYGLSSRLFLSSPPLPPFLTFCSCPMPFGEISPWHSPSPTKRKWKRLQCRLHGIVQVALQVIPEICQAHLIHLSIKMTPHCTNQEPCSWANGFFKTEWFAGKHSLSCLTNPCFFDFFALAPIYPWLECGKAQLCNSLYGKASYTG